MDFCFILLFLCLDKIKGFLIISLEIISADDCIKSIKLEDNPFLYERPRENCNDGMPGDYFENIYYEIGQKLNIEVYDYGGHCFLIANVRVNDYNYVIYTNEKNFWKCEDCRDYSLNHEAGRTKFFCYPIEYFRFDEDRLLTFHYCFQINSISDLSGIHDI